MEQNKEMVEIPGRALAHSLVGVKGEEKDSGWWGWGMGSPGWAYRYGIPSSRIMEETQSAEVGICSVDPTS